MYWYHYSALAFIIGELLVVFQMWRNYRYVMRRVTKRREVYRPHAAVIVPCKGIDNEFAKNISSFYRQDYGVYDLFFVVQDTDDPAYAAIESIRDSFSGTGRARQVNILTSGRASGCSQKIHNLLYAARQVPQDVEVIAFADSDVCASRDWLSNLVHPLRKDEAGLASGYRWYVPQRNNLATIALSAINAKVAQLLGSYICNVNQAWGGSMAIRTELFRRLEVEKVWSEAISDDLALSRLVRRAHKRIVFVPACLVATYEQTTWKDLFKFGRRQFVITRVATPVTWLFGLFAILFSVTSFYGGLVAAALAAGLHLPWAWVLYAVPVTALAAHFINALMRQHIIAVLLPQERDALKAARHWDLACSWLFSLVMLVIILSSAVGRTIYWRGIRYRLVSPTRTIIESSIQDVSGSPTR